MPGLGLLVSTGLLIRWLNGYVGLLVLHLILLFKPRLKVELWSNLLYRYYFGRLLLEDRELVPLAYSDFYSLHDFSVLSFYISVIFPTYFSRETVKIN